MTPSQPHTVTVPASDFEQGFAEMPAELLRAIFGRAGDCVECQLSVKDRLCAEATCQSWRRALRGLPFHSLELDDEEPAKCLWAVSYRPAVARVTTRSNFMLLGDVFNHLPLVLHSLDHRALLELELQEGAQELLPRPEAFPNLRRICVHDTAWDGAWLGRLAGLQRLEELELRGFVPAAGIPIPRPPLVLPALPALTSLDLDLAEDAPPLHLSLHSLPGLQKLVVRSDGAVELRAAPAAAAASASPPPAAWLRSLELSALVASVDFASLPALTSLCFVDWGRDWRVEKAAAISGCTALRDLRLVVGPGPERAWVAELLRHAPPSLRRLAVTGCLSPAAGEALAAALPQLCMLWVDAPTAAAAAPLGDSPLWSQLRALAWNSQEPLPAAASKATQLELLVCGPASLPHDIRLLSSLPALRRLWVFGDAISGVAQQATLTDTARKAMPHLEEFCILDRRASQERFGEAAQAYLLD